MDEEQNEITVQSRQVYTIEEGLQIIERRMEVLDRLRESALARTNAKSWNRWPGAKYRLTLGGAQQVARNCMIRIGEPVTGEVKDNRGNVVGISVEAEFSLPGGHDTYHALGSCEESDGFVYSDRKRTIRHADAWKKAYANCVVNGVMGLMGLGSLDDSDLKKAGISPGAIESVDVERTKRGQAPKGSEEIAPEIEEIYRDASKLLGELAGGSAAAAEEILREITSFEPKDGGKPFPGYGRVRDVSQKMIARVRSEILRRHQGMMKAMNGDDGPGEKRKATEKKAKAEGSK